MRLELSPQAVADLQSILEYVGRDQPRAAVRLVDGIEATCRKLAEMPKIGTARDELYPGLRAFSYRKYVIYSLRPREGLLRIVRIMHGARDVQPGDFRLGLS